MSEVSVNGAPSDPAVVGHVVRPHGLAGEVVVAPVGASPVDVEAGDTFWLAGAWRRVRRCRIDNKGRWVVALDGCSGRDAAEALRGADVMIEADELPQLEDDQYYIHDLIGCRVVDAAGAELGNVVRVVPGPQDQLEVERGGERILVPMARQLLQEVDLRERRIVVQVPPGLVDATRLKQGSRNET